MKKHTTKKNRLPRPHIFGALGFLLAALVIAFSVALFTSYDSITNVLSAGSLDILLIEEKYDSTPAYERDKIMPRRLTAKDPKIKNTDIADAFVFLEVRVPTALITEVEDDGTRKPESYQELFYLKTNDDTKDTSTTLNTAPASADDNGYWIELPSYETGTDCRSEYRTYVFGYSTYIKTGESTETLFDYVMFKNFVRSRYVDGRVLGITVNAVGIQAEHLPDTLADTGRGRMIQTEETLTRIYSYAQRK